MKAIKIIIASVALALVASPAFAAKSRGSRSYEPASSMTQPKFYIGVGAGQVTTTVPSQDLATISDPTKTTATNVFVGYSFNKFVAAEVEYTAFNTLEIGNDITLKSTAASVNLVGSLPMGQVADLFVKAGYSSTSNTVYTNAVAGTAQTNGGATYGGGIQFNLSKNMNLRLVVDRHTISDGTYTYNMNKGGIDVMFRF